jgi:hypothetical protein
MQDVTELIARQAELAWHMPNMAFVTNHRIKSSLCISIVLPMRRLRWFSSD